MSQQFKPDLFQQKTFFQGYLSSAMLKDIHNTIGVLQYQQQSCIIGSNMQQQSGSGIAMEQQITKRSINNLSYSPLQKSGQKKYNQFQSDFENLGLAIAIGPQHVLCNVQDIIINETVAKEEQLYYVNQDREYKVRQILYQRADNLLNQCNESDNDQGKQKLCEYAVLILYDELQEYVGMLQIENKYHFLQDYDQYNSNKCLYVLSNTFLLERQAQDIQQNTIYVEQIDQVDQICPVYIHMDSNQTSSPLLIGFYVSVNKFKQGIIQLFDSSSYLQILSWVQGFQQIMYTSQFTQEQQYPYDNLQYLTKEVLQSTSQMNKIYSSDSKQNLYKQDCVWKLQRLNHRVMCCSTGDCKLKIWDTVTNTQVRVLDLGNYICRDIICFNDILICACDNILQIFNWETGQIIQKLTFKDKIQCLGQFEAHLDVVATGHQNGYIHILKFSKRKNQWQAIQVIKNYQHEQHGHDSFINSIVGLKNYEMASAGTNGQIKIWNWQTGEFVKELQAHLPNKSVYFMKYLPDRDTIISGGSDKSVRVWDLKNNQFREYNFSNPLYSVELITSNYLCVGDGQENTSTVLHTTSARINSILKLNPLCFAVGDTAGQVSLFKYLFKNEQKQIISQNQFEENYNQQQNGSSQQSCQENNQFEKSPIKAIAETFCMYEKSAFKSQYQTESHPISSLASPLEYNTKQSQPPSNQPQESSLLVQVNNINNTNEMNSNILCSNRSNLKKSEILNNQLKKNLSNNQLLKDFQGNSSSQQTTNRNENNKYSFQENPLSSNFGQASSNFTTATQQTISNNIISQCLQDQQQELIERRQVIMNEQNVFRLKLEDRDEQLKKTHQKYNKLFEQTFMILENYEANKLVLQHLKKDFETIQLDLKRYFTNVDSIYVKQVKNLETIITYKDKEYQNQVRILEETLQAKQTDYSELEKSYNRTSNIVQAQEEDINKKNSYIELLTKQINEKDDMIMSSQDRIKELVQLVNDLQIKGSGRSITKINTPMKETPVITTIASSNLKSQDHKFNDKESHLSTSEKPVYSYRNSNKAHSLHQNTETQSSSSSPQIPAIISSTKILKNAQFPPKTTQTQEKQTCDSSQTDITFISSSNTNKTEKILQNNQLLHTPIKKTILGQQLKMDEIMNSLKLSSREQYDQQDIYESLSYKINNYSKNGGINRSKSYSKPSSNLINSQNSTLQSNNINQDNSILRGIQNSRNATPDRKENSYNHFDSNQQKQVLKNNISILNHVSNNYMSPIKSQFSPIAKSDGQFVIKTPQPTKISTQSREDLIKQVNDPQPPSLQQITAEIENTYSRQSFDTTKWSQQRSEKLLQTNKPNQIQDRISDINTSYLSKAASNTISERENINQKQSFETNKFQQQKDYKSIQNEKLIQYSEKILEKVIPSKVGNITIQSRIIRSSQQHQQQ